jgi:hypothetical protein
MPETIKKFRMRCFQPFKKRAGIVEADAHVGMTLQHLNERQIGRRIGTFQHGFEISHGLVRVNEEDKVKSRHRNLSKKKSELA